jgi:hypothetical protein
VYTPSDNSISDLTVTILNSSSYSQSDLVWFGLVHLSHAGIFDNETDAFGIRFPGVTRREIIQLSVRRSSHRARSITHNETNLDTSSKKFGLAKLAFELSFSQPAEKKHLYFLFRLNFDFASGRRHL